MPSFLRLLSLCLVVVLPLFSLQAQSTNTAQAYKPLTSEQLRNISYSPRHLIVSLAGDWERIVEDEAPTTIALPHSETECGTFRYRRTFTIREDLQKNYTWHLYCLGVNYRSDIRLNGVFLRSHIGGSVPFKEQIPEGAIRKGVNSIEFEVNNELNSFSTIPLRREPYGEKTYGGVYREVFLVGTPHIWVGGFSLRNTFNSDYSRCDIRAKVMLSSGSFTDFSLPADSTGESVTGAMGKLDVSVSAEILSAESKTLVASVAPQNITVEPNRKTDLDFALAVDAPALWSPESPNLYILKVYIRSGANVIEEYSRHIGLRDVRTGRSGATAQILLNGKPFEIKGVDYIENSDSRRATLNMQDYERDVISLKTLGANALRIRHSSPHPYLVHLCNRYGLFILPELPVVQVPRTILEEDNYIATAKNSMQEILAVYEVNPSVMAWGIADGLAEATPAARNYARELQKVIREVSAKCIYKVVTDGAPKVESSGFDFIIYSIRAKSIEAFRGEVRRLLAAATGTPGILSFGLAIQPDNNRGYSDPLSVESQAKYIRDRYKMLKEAGLGSGVMLWSYNDYFTDRPILVTNYHRSYVATSGLVSANRDTRFTYDMVKALFNDENEPFITAGSHQPSSPYIYTIISLGLLIVLFVLINGSRRFRENVVRALVRPYNFYADIRDQRILSNARTVILALIISGGLGMMLSSILYYLRDSYQLDYILVKLIPLDQLKEYVDISIWMPEISVLAATLIFLTIFFFAALVIRIGSLFVRSRIFFNDAFVIAVWAALPVVMLLFLTMGLYKVLEFGGFTELILLLVVAVTLWILYRILRGTAVIYDVWAPNIYAIGIALLSVFTVAVLLLYDAAYSIFAFFRYFMDVIYV